MLSMFSNVLLGCDYESRYMDEVESGVQGTGKPLELDLLILVKTQVLGSLQWSLGAYVLVAPSTGVFICETSRFSLFSVGCIETDSLCPGQLDRSNSKAHLVLLASIKPDIPCPLFSKPGTFAFDVRVLCTSVVTSNGAVGAFFTDIFRIYNAHTVFAAQPIASDVAPACAYHHAYIHTTLIVFSRHGRVQTLPTLVHYCTAETATRTPLRAQERHARPRSWRSGRCI
ncbi:hypothetical protein BDV95DRAFT_157780 [Massariosphaeria phaeospora]|uniref:Uncharacterized protein n=1 Tax=Massariosphaeria phaeospora TaxID=100035 RepID=A0A7C8M550_9PLEO|nr:hypothetical protein BDV95DRAFT_157780 [Massariosphaeria phaeospora]